MPRVKKPIKPASPPAETPKADEERLQRDPKTGHFLPGCRLWEARSRAGRRPKFETPEALWAACVEYFEWCEANPLVEDNLVVYQGNVKHETTSKMRAMTQSGLCIFLDIDYSAWRHWRVDRPDLVPMMERVEQIIYTQKFSGAAAGLLNPLIIARELGLSDKTELTGKAGGPVQTVDVSLLSPTERAQRMAAILSKLNTTKDE